MQKTNQKEMVSSDAATNEKMKLASVTMLAGLNVFFLVAAIYMGFFFNPFAAIPEEALITEGKEALIKHSDQLLLETGKILKETTPTVAGAFQEQLRDDLPAYLNISSEEGEILVENLEGRIKKISRRQWDESLGEFREVLKEELPEIASEESLDRLVKEFETARNALLDRYYITEFRQATEKTVKLWNEIEPVPEPYPGDPKLEEQFLDYAQDWSVLRLEAALTEQK